MVTVANADLLGIQRFAVFCPCDYGFGFALVRDRRGKLAPFTCYHKHDSMELCSEHHVDAQITKCVFW